MTKYDVPEDILHEFYEFRYNMYIKRKEYYTKILRNDMNILKYKVKFLREKCDGKIIIERRKRSDVIQQLIDLKFPKL